MNKTLKWVIGIIILILVVWGLSIFTGEQNVSVENSEPIKIGFIGPLTGEAAEYGEESRNTVELAVNEINEKGGVRGRQIEVIYEDGACSGAGAASAANKLISVDKVDVILGGVCSGESLSAVPVAERGKTMLVSAWSSSTDLTGISDYFVRTYPSDDSQGIAFAEYAEESGWNNVAVIQEQTDYSLGVFNVFSDNFDGNVIKEEFATGKADLRTSLTKLKGANPDALLIITQTSSSADRILKQTSELNWDPQLVFSEVIGSDASFLEINKERLEGAISVTFRLDTNDEKLKSALSEYVIKYGGSPIYDTYFACQYDTVMLIAEALKDVNFDTSKLSSWFRKVKDWPGISGNITIKQDGDRDAAFKLFIIKDGRPEFID